jgi:phosphomannomutase
MAVKLEKKGFSIYNQLQFLNSTYGEFVSYNSYVICHDALKIDSIFTRLRTGGENGEYINFFENVKIKSIKDVTKGFDSTITNGVSLLPTTPDSHMIMYEFANDISVTLRTSGTEPKIKYYTEIAGKVGQKKNELTDLLHYFVDKVIIEMLQPTLNGLL